MSDLDFIGADGLSTKYIVLRVRSLDADKLKQKLGGYAGASVPLALSVLNVDPSVTEFALKGALPSIAKLVRDDYGVDLEWQVMNAPPPKGEDPPSRIGAGIVIGGSLVGMGWAVWHFALRSLLGRI